MDERFVVTRMFICTFKFDNGIRVIPNVIRYCLIDKQQGIVIDLEDELKYNYIESASKLYFINESLKRVKENKRAAMTEIQTLTVDKNVGNKALRIRKELEQGKIFPNGNDVFNNEEYLEHIEKQRLEELKRYNIDEKNNNGIHKTLSKKFTDVKKGR